MRKGPARHFGARLRSAATRWEYRFEEGLLTLLERGASSLGPRLTQSGRDHPATQATNAAGLARPLRLFGRAAIPSVPSVI